MGFQIQDGTGSSRKAGVNNENRLQTLSVVESRVSDVSGREGKSFILASGFISIGVATGDTFQAHTYIKNNSDDDLFIEAIRLCSTAGSGGMNMEGFQTKLVKNPTSGTIIGDAIEAPGINPSNLGSNQTFDGTVYVASASGKTFTDGSFMSNFTTHSPGHTIQIYSGALILSKGSSLGIELKPTAAGEVCSEIQCWFESPLNE